MSLGELASFSQHLWSAYWVPDPVLEVEKQAKIPVGVTEHAQDETTELMALVGGKCLGGKESRAQGWGWLLVLPARAALNREASPGAET